MKLNSEQIKKAAEIISQRVVDEWYGGEEFPEDCQTFQEMLRRLLVGNPHECEKLIGTAFCEEEEIYET